jgi:hypothetical protein
MKTLASLALITLLPVAAHAVVTVTGTYGDLVGNTVRYQQITESSGTDTVPLYGAPSISADSLSFNPTFSASSGGGGIPDITDGQLNFDILAKNGTNGPYNTVISNVQFAEAGDFTLAGFSAGGTYVNVSAHFTVTIKEVDGIAVDPFFEQVTMVISPNADGTFQLGIDGDGPSYSESWNGFVDIDVAQILNNKGDAYQFGATKVSVVLDNVLTAGSESSTNAYIAKKVAQGMTVTALVTIPEPSSAALLGLGGLALMIRRRR